MEHFKSSALFSEDFVCRTQLTDWCIFLWFRCIESESEVWFMESAPMVFVGTVMSVEAIEDAPKDDAWLWQTC